MCLFYIKLTFKTNILGEAVEFQSNHFFRANLLQTSWHYLTCPRENECSNGHHDCDPVSDVCLDKDDGFSCDCNVGYNRTNDGEDESAGSCEPVCQACDHGDCVKPGECRYS